MTLVSSARRSSASSVRSARSKGEQTLADLPRFPDRLQAGREFPPFLMTEIVVAGAGGDHQPIVAYRFEIPRFHRLALRIDPRHLGHQDLYIPEPAQRFADRLGDVGGRQRRRRHLVEQRLEQVVIAPVDQRDADIGVAELPGAGQPAEPAADDDHMRWLARSRFHIRIHRIRHRLHIPLG